MNRPIDQACEMLSKHHEVVVILTSDYQAETTNYQTKGVGNHFAREAMVTNYIRNIENGCLAHELKHDDSDDHWKADE